MRIKFIVPLPLNKQQVEKRSRQIPPGCANPGTDVVFVPVKNSARWADSAHDSLLLDFFTYEEGLASEDEGFDGVCVDTISDSAVAPLRSRLNIPVVGPGQASYHLASMLGNKFSIVSMWDAWRHLYVKSLKEYELTNRCASIRDIGMVPDNRELLGGKEAEVLPLLEACCRRCIEEDRADVIVLGSTTMHEAHRYLSERVPVPVLNPGLVALKLCEALVSIGLSQSKQAYAAPAEPKDQLVRTAVAAVAIEQSG